MSKIILPAFNKKIQMKSTWQYPLEKKKGEKYTMEKNYQQKTH